MGYFIDLIHQQNKHRPYLNLEIVFHPRVLGLSDRPGFPPLVSPALPSPLFLHVAALDVLVQHA